MYIERLQLTNFKNYEAVDVQFSNNVNCLVGNNGVGKTNLLDALYYLSFCKSYFNPVDSQNIRSGCEYFAIHGNYRLDDSGGVGSPSLSNIASPNNDQDSDHHTSNITHHTSNNDQVVVSCTFQRGQSKKVKFNKKLCATFAEHIGRVPLVIVTPSDQSLILGGSEVRRKFIDGIISQVDKNYLQSLLAYQKALEQRNRLLKQFYENRYFEEDSIAIWDEQLVRYGEPVSAARWQFLDEFRPLFEQYYLLIHPQAASGECPRVVYSSQIGPDSPSFAAQLTEGYRRDAQTQYTTVGPHKDDLDFFIGDFPVKRFASQGQQKTFLLALKLAQFEYIRLHLGTKPILLLDDMFDKLDMLRVSQLVFLVGSDRFGQVFITDTQPGRVQAIFREAPDMPHRIFSVANGALSCGDC